jgi:hypothetical protein
MSDSLYVKFCLVKMILCVMACDGCALVEGCMQYFSLDLNKASRVHLLLCSLLSAYVVYFCNEHQVLVHDQRAASFLLQQY